MKNQLKTFLLLGALGALVVAIGGLAAPGLLPLFLVLALAMNVGAYWFSDRIVLKLHGAREVSPAEAPELHAMVAELAGRAGIPKPRVCIMPDVQPNAFATGRSPEHGVVAVTEGILRLLTPRELRGVLAHELAHIQNRDILVASVAACMTAVVSYVGNALTFGALLGRSDEEGEGGGSLFAALLAPIGATLVQLGISRSREYLADETGARLCGDPDALADALMKLSRGAELVPSANPQPATASLFIVSPLAGAGGLASLFSTHPAMEERVRRLRALSRVHERVGHPGLAISR